MYFGGMPFGDGMGSFEKRPPADTTKYYKLLEIDKSASVAEIKKAYRKLAIKHHPDKGGDPEQFKALSRAYEVLSDSQKRAIYDEHGEEGLEEGGGGGGDASDIFNLFFGGGQSRSSSRVMKKRQGECIKSAVRVTLEQLYTGTVRKLAVTRDRLCSSCDGIGGPKDALINCSGCKGTGMRVTIRQSGPMIQQTQHPCRDCMGQGQMMPESKKCKSCKATGTSKDRRVFEVEVEKGVISGHKVVFNGEADHKPGEIAGDLVFEIIQLDHDRFKRDGDNLFLDHTITLYEALTGFQFELIHLDGRRLVIESPPGQSIQPGQVRGIEGEGMPLQRATYRKGMLFITFNIVFPDPLKLPKGFKESLSKILPTPPPFHIDHNDPTVEHCVAEVVNPNDSKYKSTKAREVYHDDDDEDGHEGHGGHGGQNVQCRQQ